MKCINKDPYTPLKQIYEQSEKLQELCSKYPDIDQVVKIAIQIEGLPRNTSTHAAGIIMTKEDLVTYTPLDEGLNDIYQTQYEAVDLEKLGLKPMLERILHMGLYAGSYAMLEEDYDEEEN